MNPRQAAESCHRAVQSLQGTWSRGIPHGRCLHSSRRAYAVALPSIAHGPPPSAPLPGPAQYLERITRRQERARTHDQSDTARPAQKKRFWKDVSVQEVHEGYQILLDRRPVRTPAKNVLTVPKNKSQLASAIALEWDLLTTGHQALKHHFIPLTSLVSRAESIRDADHAQDASIREEVVQLLMTYLDTDTTLCWAPQSAHQEETQEETQDDGSSGRARSLRHLQKESARRLITFLTYWVWPGVEIHYVAEGDGIVPESQPRETKDVIRGWINGLEPYDLAGLERAAIAGKSLLIAARLVAEWSTELRRHARLDGDQEPSSRFGAEEAAEAASLEVRWQTGMWGEVEDTHDVEKEDLLRQFGSVVLLISGD